ncbi:MAG: ferritin [Bacteroidia bacterium]|nr:MAG: ferritin [Bacteroidia bacterium]
MLNKKVEKALNEQIEKEHYASQLYLAMASWTEVKGYNGTATFLYKHSQEEREHMLKLFHYVNDRGGHAIVPKVDQPPQEYKSIQDLFEAIYEHELMVSASINELMSTSSGVKDYATQNFLQWYVEEQMEEETLFRTILDKLQLLGNKEANMYMFDNEMSRLADSVDGGDE